MAFLYLLPNFQMTGFKIGVTTDLRARLASIAAPLNERRCYSFEAAPVQVFSLEQRLHKVFDRWRYTEGYGSGNTEWFRIDAFEPAFALLREFASELSVGRPTLVFAEHDTNNRKLVEHRRNAAILDARDDPEVVGYFGRYTVVVGPEAHERYREAFYADLPGVAMRDGGYGLTFFDFPPHKAICAGLNNLRPED